MTDSYAVMGNPIGHSKSAQIHAAFAAQCGQEMSYSALLIPEDAFEEQVAKFFSAGGKGLNITLPFKLRAWQLSDVLSKRAQLAGSVNTLIPGKDGKIYGDNTDGVGLVRDLTANMKIAVESKDVLVLGAGGAVRGILGVLLEQRPRRLVVANRTPVKAQELAKHFAGMGDISASAFSGLAGQRFDLIVNGTSASLHQQVPDLPPGIFAANAWCYDMMYSADETAFNRWARMQGAKTVDGLGMLVEQAAESFYLWRGQRPKTAPVIELLRQQLNG